mmetsp:Transcript_22682/g.31012  ORF Transcript_22682/g.31012 Transcript_22682/m.31012 type:complete len:92 (-) Transcript_22682:338-613(-)
MDFNRHVEYCSGFLRSSTLECLVSKALEDRNLFEQATVEEHRVDHEHGPEDKYFGHRKVEEYLRSQTRKQDGDGCGEPFENAVRVLDHCRN